MEADWEQIKAIFNKRDTNGSGKLSQEKVKLILREATPDLTEKEADRLIALAAKDGVGDPFDATAFLDWMYGGSQTILDKACKANDVKVLVALLQSQTPIEVSDKRDHEWADNPKTVGANACTHLVVLAASGKENIKNEIRDAGVFPALLQFLKSDQSDRVHVAIVALSFVTADCDPNSVAAYEAGFMPALLPLLGSGVPGMRLAVCTTLRNICMASMEYRKKFVETGGIKGFIGLMTDDPATVNKDLQLEAMLNLQDLLLDNEDNLIPEFAKLSLEAGAEAKLQTALKAGDEEVKSTAQEVMGVLKGGG